MSATLSAKVQRTAHTDDLVRQFMLRSYVTKPVISERKLKSLAKIKAAREAAIKSFMDRTKDK